MKTNEIEKKINTFNSNIEEMSNMIDKFKKESNEIIINVNKKIESIENQNKVFIEDQKKEVDIIISNYRESVNECNLIVQQASRKLIDYEKNIIDLSNSINIKIDESVKLMNSINKRIRIIYIFCGIGFVLLLCLMLLTIIV